MMQKWMGKNISNSHITYKANEKNKEKYEEINIYEFSIGVFFLPNPIYMTKIKIIYQILYYVILN